ncbi:MAG: adenosylcobinamide-GDP ribazoletransferase [Aphanothece sp. CMT-3BRIN-NPC111]|jgi:adenosylcobinamide-GDP ribazoletransferase|nr:adenosylcobinamide-GDP ribazoletransferase [Aphanothece sp. CMT-3BRIN-NPC111]
MKWFRDQLLASWGRPLAAAIAFYTCLPIPSSWALEFWGVARWAPTVGLLIGGLLGLGDMGLQYLGIPVLTRSALVVVSWIALTGGLHLDGVMDTADGLAVQDPSRRLQVMVDSATGAFGAMAAIALLLLKTSALSDLDDHRWLALMAAAGWGRWGQVVAIAYYPYLKPTGKGAFHKQAVRTQDIFVGLLLLLGLSGLQVFLNAHSLPMAIVTSAGGCAIALLTGAWFHQQLGGHTGDTYGAVVEWTEALFLCLLTVF